MSRSYLFKNLKDTAGKPLELAVSNGRFVKVDSASANFELIDGKGLTAIPGLVDLHTHLREPGKEDAETVLSGSTAAVAGGFTAISATVEGDNVDNAVLVSCIAILQDSAP